MIEISPYAVLQAMVNDEASPLESPDGHVFTQRFVEATTVLAAYGDGNQSQNVRLCAYGLLSWPEDRRADYLAKFNVPGPVYQQLAAPGDWPFMPVDQAEVPAIALPDTEQ